MCILTSRRGCAAVFYRLLLLFWINYLFAKSKVPLGVKLGGGGSEVWSRARPREQEECCFLLLFLSKNPMNESKKENSLVCAHRLFISMTLLAVGKC